MDWATPIHRTNHFHYICTGINVDMDYAECLIVVQSMQCLAIVKATLILLQSVFAFYKAELNRTSTLLELTKRQNLSFTY